MEGKVLDDEEGHQQWVYVSRDLMKQLQKDSIGGSIHLNGRDLQIAGVYDHQYKEEGVKRVIGSAFICSKYPGVCYFRISPQADVRATMKKMEAICRKYVPESLPLDLRLFTDKRATSESVQNTIYYGFGIMAFISLLVVMLSIYSAISMDTVSRQKEVAIRKINGATPKVIAWMFGRNLYHYLSACLPVGISAFKGNTHHRIGWRFQCPLPLGLAVVDFLRYGIAHLPGNGFQDLADYAHQSGYHH